MADVTALNPTEQHECAADRAVKSNPEALFYLVVAMRLEHSGLGKYLRNRFPVQLQSEHWLPEPYEFLGETRCAVLHARRDISIAAAPRLAQAYASLLLHPKLDDQG